MVQRYELITLRGGEGYLTKSDEGRLVSYENYETLIAQLEAAQKELGDQLNQEFQQRLANAEHQLYMKDLAIHNIKASRKAQFRKRLAAEAALSAANERLKGEQVPMFEVEISCGHWLNMGPISGADLSKLPDGINKLFTAPQKPVVLPDYRCSPDMHTKQFIDDECFVIDPEDEEVCIRASYSSKYDGLFTAAKPAED